MNEAFKIYLDRLKGGTTEKIDFSCSPDFLEIAEKDLHFVDDVSIKGEAYLAEDQLILHLDMHATAKLTCAICNAPVSVNIQIDGFYHSEPLADTKNGIFNFSDTAREAILLETPAFAECNQGQCAQRADIDKYLRKQSDAPSPGNDEGEYRPFADIDLDKFKPPK